jgi:aminoglycoside 6'-N-acetyltransferase I
VIIRPLQAQDLDAWTSLRAALWPHHSAPKLREEAERFLAWAQFGAVYVAQDEGRLVGMIEASLRPYADGCASSPVPYIEGWFVEDAYRKTGVGRLLVTAVEVWAAGEGYTELASDAELENSVSHAAHKALGFEETDRIICYRKAL